MAGEPAPVAASHEAHAIELPGRGQALAGMSHPRWYDWFNLLIDGAPASAPVLACPAVDPPTWARWDQSPISHATDTRLAFARLGFERSAPHICGGGIARGRSRELLERQKEAKVARKRAKRAVARRAVKRAAVRRAVKKRAVKRALVRRAVKRRAVKRVLVRRAVKKRAVKRALVRRAVKRRAVKRALVRRVVGRAIIARALAQRMGEGSTQ
jgi:hypothetical protein